MAKKDGVLKILTVGNSHGLDATRMLYDVFKEQAPDQKIILGNLYYSGCRVSQHAEFMTGKQAKYDYHKNADGNWVVNLGCGSGRDGASPEKRVIADVAIEDEQWDIVIMQQMNYWAGVEGLYDKGHFTTVLNYIKQRQKTTPEFRWHMVWPNPENVFPTASTDWKMYHEKYFGDNEGVYKSINLYNKVTQLTQKYITDSTDFLGEKVFADVIPTATAIEYAIEVCGRPQSEFYRDYTHLTGYARLICSYLWYAKLMGVDEITYVGHDTIKAEHLNKGKYCYPEEVDGVYPVDAQMKADLLAAVNWALKHPYELPQAE